jgi:hypothetical protein
VRSGLRPVAEVTRADNHYDIRIEADVPEWVIEHLVAPMDSVARTSDGGITVAVHASDGNLG